MLMLLFNTELCVIDLGTVIPIDQREQDFNSIQNDHMPSQSEILYRFCLSNVIAALCKQYSSAGIILGES